MEEGKDPARASNGGDAEAVLVSIGESLARIAAQFDAEGALGILAVDASDLAKIEHIFGGEPHARAIGDLAALVGELIGNRLGINDLILTGETGRNEVLVLVFRESNEIDFYKRELPELRRDLADSLRRRSGRVGYPYLKGPPSLHVGIGAALRNPTIGAASQVRSALVEARDEAELNARVAARRRRQRLLELVVEGRVTSVYEQSRLSQGRRCSAPVGGRQRTV